ncbi:DUF2865 domain-containing protein [Tardiphaga alba]|uniref:DUF2865 domain-containing protein n=1 Tax=Tardiphaga alba TaxID=340268 RepID=A0ABX8A4A6_9BRAD|nr:DUF2865 domain-containing protein [Tardiphaga alba]QUS38207.1 DUF2865 domain-containing protein [Tardiphaga alba]
MSRVRRPLLAFGVIASVAVIPEMAAAQGFFDFLFGGGQPQKQQQRRGAPAESSFFDPFGLNTPAEQPAPQRSAGGGSGAAFCVRTCDGKYFPLTRGGASPAQMCQAFCPASTTKVFFGSNIDYAASSTGERYADMPNAFAYRKALKADCTCNGRDPAGLAPVDLTLDTSLRPGDVVATTNGLVAFNGMRTGNTQAAEFTPVASYPGLTSDVRARLGEMKVAPVAAEMITDEAPMAETPREIAPLPAATTIAPKRVSAPAAKRAELN